MFIKFQGTWRGHEIYVNPAHVKTIRPMEEINNVVTDAWKSERKSFVVAGHTLVEYAVAGSEDCLVDTVLGTLDEVAAKLNGGPA